MEMQQAEKLTCINQLHKNSFRYCKLFNIVYRNNLLNMSFFIRHYSKVGQKAIKRPIERLLSKINEGIFMYTCIFEGKSGYSVLGGEGGVGLVKREFGLVDSFLKHSNVNLMKTKI